MRTTIGKGFIIFGIILLIASAALTYQRVNPSRLKFENYAPDDSSTVNIVGVPKRLIIDDLGINLEVVPGNIKNDKWSTTYDGVSYLSSSPIPGTAGNSILYGHNWASLLGNLKSAKPGQVIEIVDDSGKVTKFEISFVQVVGPNEKSILDQTSDSRITLYTCTGFLDTKRLVVTALKI